MTKKQYGQVTLGMFLLVFGGVVLDVTMQIGVLGPLAALAALITMTICSWFRLKDAGWSPWLAILIPVPLVGFILFVILIFKPGKAQPLPLPAQPKENP